MCATMGRSDGLNITLVGTIKALVFFKLKTSFYYISWYGQANFMDRSGN